MFDSVLRVFFVYLFVSVVAAAIAYLSNQLGRHIGKRKMSVLHLRPRHTSILITTCSGVAIAAITLTAFAFLSEPVRGLLTGVEKLREEEAALRLRVDSLRHALEEGAFVWKVDEPIVHMTIPAGLSLERTRGALTCLLAEANSKTILQNNEVAKGKGAPILRADDILVDYDQEALEHMCDELSRGQGMMGVRIVAKQNVLFGDKAPVRIEAWQVRLVFREGQEVCRQRGSTSEPMLDFFRFIELTRQKAIKKGLRPIGGSLGGELSGDALDSLQDTIRQQEGPFELVAIANRDLYETSSLDIHVEVHPLSQESGSDGEEAW